MIFIKKLSNWIIGKQKVVILSLIDQGIRQLTKGGHLRHHKCFYIFIRKEISEACMQRSMIDGE